MDVGLKLRGFVLLCFERGDYADLAGDGFVGCDLGIWKGFLYGGV